MSKRKPCRTECWFDALLLESRKDLKFKGAFLSAERHPQHWSCHITIGIVAPDNLVREVVKAYAAPKEKISLHTLAKTVMAEAATECVEGDVIRYVRIHAIKQ